MDKKKIVVLSGVLGLAVALLAALLLLLGRGEKAAEGPAAPLQATQTSTAALAEATTAAPTEDPRLPLSSGPVDRDATSLALASVTEADLPLLKELTGLTSLDGRACENYALLQAFSQTVAYPVLWSVPLGDSRVDSDSETLRVPLSVTTAAEVEGALQALPAVKSVDLRDSGLDNEQVALLREAKPELSFEYYVTVQGGKDDVSTRVLELSADSIQDWDALAREIGYLPDLERIVVTGAITPEQAAYLLEGAGSRIPVSYSVSFRGRSIDSDAEELDLSDLSPSDWGDIQGVLSVLPGVKKVNLDPASGASKWTLDEADRIQSLREGLLVNYTTSAFGVKFSLADEVVSFNKKNLKRKMEELRLLLPYLRNVKRLDMEDCSIDNETMAALRDEFSSPKIVWRVRVGGYSVRTDAWMIKFSAGGGRTLQDKDVGNLKYLRELKYMDLGHNKLRHMDFAAYMPDLEVCIMYNPMTSLKGVEACKKLEYFECFSCMVRDISPLAACTELKHLNLVWDHITDITPLYNLTKLERLWISRNEFPADQLARFKELVPDCVVNTTAHNPTSEGWREDDSGNDVPRYALLRQQFHYDKTEVRSYGDGWWEDSKFHTGTPPAASPEA